MLEVNKKNIRIWSMLGMRRVLGMMLAELREADEKFMFVTADVARYFGTEEYEKKYPKNFIDVGIAEQNLITVSAGLQKEGLNALAATYSTFITARAMDQIRVCLGYMKMPIVLVGVGAGLAEGDLSATHMGLEDIAMIRSIPNIRIIEPADCLELIKVLYATADHKQPTYIRLTGKTNLARIYMQDYEFKVGKSVMLKDGKDKGVIISAGVVTYSAIEASELIKDEVNYDFSVVNMHTIKPIDEEFLDSIINFDYIVVVEEHMKSGGLGSAVIEYYARKKRKPRILVLGVDDFYPNANDYEDLISECGLNSKGIACSIIDFLNN